LASVKEVILKKPAELKAKNTPIIRLFFVKVGGFAEFILEHSEGFSVIVQNRPVIFTNSP